MKQGWDGVRRSKALRGWENLRALHSRELEVPVLVAARCQSAGGAKNLRRVGFVFFVCFRMREESGAARVGLHLRVGRKVMRG
jgi:hypothetical protein